MRARALVHFLARVVVIDALLMVAWRWIGPAYEAAYRLAAGLGFDLAGFGGAIALRPSSTTSGVGDTTIAIDLEACTIWWYAQIDTWSLSYAPAALFVALVLATPGGWHRAFRRLAVGGVLTFVYSLVRVAAVIAKGLIDHLPQCGGDHGGFVTGELGRGLARTACALFYEHATLTFFVSLLAWIAVVRPSFELLTGTQESAGRPRRRTPGSWSNLRVWDYS